MTFDIQSVRARFPALSIADGGVPRIYLDNPAGTQVPQSVADAMTDMLLQTNANLGGYFVTSELCGAIVDGARLAMADLINAPTPDEIVFGPSMTTLTLHLSRSLGRQLQAGDEVVVTRMDHDANVEPWRLMARDNGFEIKWLPFDLQTFEFDLAELDGLLTDRTKLVCVGGASNLTGTIHDVKTICAKAHDAGAQVFVDAVQSVPHVATDVQDLDCDFLACSPYKFFGPHMGVLWGRRELLDALEPYRVRPAPASAPGSFETGTLNHEGMAGTAAAVDYLASVGATLGANYESDGFDGRRGNLRKAMHCLFEYETSLAAQLIEGLQTMPGVTVQGITDEAALGRRVPTVSFTVDNVHPDDIARELAADNIFVWSGHNYAVEAAMALGIYDTGGAVRVGPVHYNTADEMTRALTAIEQVIAGQKAEMTA